MAALKLEKDALELQICKIEIDNEELAKQLADQRGKNLELQNSKEQHRMENETLKSDFMSEVQNRDRKIEDFEEKFRDVESVKIRNRELQAKCEDLEGKLRILTDQLEDTEI